MHSNFRSRYPLTIWQTEACPPAAASESTSQTNWYQKFGNLSQIASAVFSALTMLIAFYVVNSTVPFFQVKILSEEKARLTSQIDELRLKTWTMTCSLASSKALSGVGFWRPGPIVLTQADMSRMKLRSNPSTNIRFLISDGLASADFSALEKDDQNQFKTFARDYVTGLSARYEIPLDGQQLPQDWTESQVDEAEQQLRSACEKSWPSRK